jgi:hypothetical protein
MVARAGTAGGWGSSVRTWGEVYENRVRSVLLPEVDPRPRDGFRAGSLDYGWATVRRSFHDPGRVFLDGESADQWSHGAGGGLFFITPGRRRLMSLQVARSERSTAVYVRAGLVF